MLKARVLHVSTLSNKWVLLSNMWRPLSNMWRSLSNIWRPLLTFTCFRETFEDLKVTFITNASALRARWNSFEISSAEHERRTYGFEIFNASFFSAPEVCVQIWEDIWTDMSTKKSTTCTQLESIWYFSSSHFLKQILRAIAHCF